MKALFIKINFFYQCLHGLKAVDLSHSKKLIKVSNFSSMKILEILILEGCTSFCYVDRSIGVLKSYLTKFERL